MFKEITAISKNYAIVKIDNVINDDLLNLNVIFEENNKIPMTSFPQLSDSDLENLIAYTSEPKAVAAAPAVGTVALPAVDTSGDGITNNIILGALSLVMAMLVVMLFLVNNVDEAVFLKWGKEHFTVHSERMKKLNKVKYKYFFKQF